MRLRELPGRIIVGSYVLHTGLEKWKGDEETAKAIHSMASEAYPIFASMTPETFLRLLATGEMAVGIALLFPGVSTANAGLSLCGFSGALLGMYARTPSLRKENSIWPSRQGVAVSKDSWMFAIGLGLLIDALTRREHRPKRSREGD